MTPRRFEPLFLGSCPRKPMFQSLYWSSEFKTPRISRHGLTAVAISGPGVQFRPPTRSMLPDFEDEGALLPARKSPQIRATSRAKA